MRLAFVFYIPLLVSACSNTFQALGDHSSLDLWMLQRTTQSESLLLHVEAELASRGEKTNFRSHLGDRSSSHVGLPRFNRESQALSLVKQDKNCSDFKYPLDAQVFFLSNGGPVFDNHNLDADGDGFACEWGTELKRNVRTVKRLSRKSKYNSKCYIGPRGGTYTITSSGRKNYGGC